MAEPPRTAALQVGGSGASKTLSQLLARILDQLSLSAWLPSAGLTLLIALVMQLGSSLSGPNRATSPGEATSRAFAALGNTSIGGLILLVAVIVVMTMLTQAFSFEAIRVLEGYWGTNEHVERIACWRCDRHRKKFDGLSKLHDQLRQAAWNKVAEKIEAEQQELEASSHSREFTAKMISFLGARVMGLASDVKLTAKQREVVDAFDWRASAPPDLLRRQLNVDKKLDDYPEDAQHVAPTRLGNVLRKYEDDTRSERVEFFVENAYDSLPFSMQLSHDEQRARLDLYCSMVFVLLLAGTVAVVRFGLQHWNYGLSAAVVSIAGSVVTYRAAIASARYYGRLLVAVADYVERLQSATSAATAA